MKTIYFTQGFVYQANGNKTVLRGAPPIQCKTADEAINKALRISKGSTYAGVVAGAQQYDDTTEEAGAFKLLAQYGDVPPTNE